jgi:hypothetical protein
MFLNAAPIQQVGKLFERPGGGYNSHVWVYVLNFLWNFLLMEIVSHMLFVEFLVNDNDMDEFVEFCLIFMVGLGQVVGWVVNLAFKDSHWCNTFF